MRIKLDEKEGLETGCAIQVEKRDQSPNGRVSVSVWNGKEHASVDLGPERARQVAMALITAFGGGGDAG